MDEGRRDFLKGMVAVIPAVGAVALAPKVALGAIAALPTDKDNALSFASGDTNIFTRLKWWLEDMVAPKQVPVDPNQYIGGTPLTMPGLSSVGDIIDIQALGGEVARLIFTGQNWIPLTTHREGFDELDELN